MAIVERNSGGGGGGGGTEMLDWKNSVRAATTAPVTLSGLPTIDGVTMGPDERLLVKDQTDQTENGIWGVAPGSWTRTGDANSNEFVTSGLTVYVSEGVTNGTKIFNLITTDPINLGSTNLVFQEFGAGTPGGGTVTGTGTPPQVAFWETTTGLTGDDNFTYDGTLRIGGLGNTLLQLYTNGGSRGPYLEWNNSFQSGGSIWSAMSTGPSDTSGAGNFLITQNGEHPLAFLLQKNTGFAGFARKNPQYQIDALNDIQIISTSTTGSTLHLTNTGFGGYEWRVRSCGAADLGGQGAFVIASYSDGTVPFCIAPATNNIGFGEVNPLSTLHLNGSLTIKRVAVTTNYSITASDYMIAVTDTSSPRTVLLPSSGTVGAGKTYIIKDSSGAAATNNITVATDGIDVIDGSLTYMISNNHASVQLVSNGVAGWDIIN